MSEPLTLNCYYLESECYYPVSIHRDQSVFDLVQQLVEVRKSDPQADPDTIVPIAVYKPDITTWFGDVWHHTIDDLPSVQRLHLWDRIGEVIGRIADYPGLAHIIVICTWNPPTPPPSLLAEMESLQPSPEELVQPAPQSFVAKWRSFCSRRKAGGE